MIFFFTSEPAGTASIGTITMNRPMANIGRHTQRGVPERHVGGQAGEGAAVAVGGGRNIGIQRLH